MAWHGHHLCIAVNVVKRSHAQGAAHAGTKRAVVRCRCAARPDRRRRTSGRAARPPPRRRTGGTWSACGCPETGNGSVSHREASAGTGRRNKQAPYGNRTARGCNIPPRASGQTSVGSLSTSTLGAPRKAAQQRTAACSAGAASPGPGAWHQRQWGAVHRHGRWLQARSVPATQAGRWGKGQARQHLRPHSGSGRACAVTRVTANPGKRTPGGEGATWPPPAKQTAALETLRRRGYPQTPWHATPSGSPDDAGPGHAGPRPARPGPHRRDRRGPTVLRVVDRTVDGGRHRALRPSPA
jgi:RNA-directed DNA polymerase